MAHIKSNVLIMSQKNFIRVNTKSGPLGEPSCFRTCKWRNCILRNVYWQILGPSIMKHLPHFIPILPWLTLVPWRPFKTWVQSNKQALWEDWVWSYLVCVVALSVAFFLESAWSHAPCRVLHPTRPQNSQSDRSQPHHNKRKA